MGFNYFDYTANYNFSQEHNDRKDFSNNGKVIGEIELDNNFFAELVKDGRKSSVSDRITVWLCHRKHKEKIYAFTVMAGVMIYGKDTAMQNIVKMKFATNYAKLIETYTKRYCSTVKKMTNKISIKD